MCTLEELKTWWEVPAVAHFFSLFKSCFMLTDFTIEVSCNKFLGVIFFLKKKDVNWDFV